MEKLHLQTQELLIELQPMLPAQQELEYAALGCGVVLLHVGGDVAATGKERAFDGPVTTSSLGTLGARVVCPGERLWGNSVYGEPGSSGSRTILNASLMGFCCALAQTRLLAPIFLMSSLSPHLWAASGVPGYFPYPGTLLVACLLHGQGEPLLETVRTWAVELEECVGLGVLDRTGSSFQGGTHRARKKWILL